MKMLQNVNLAEYNCFRVGGKAEYFCKTNNSAEIEEALAFAHSNSLALTILGGGSNILISDAGLKGLVVVVDIKGIEIVDRTNLRIGAGEQWDDVVAFAVAHNLWGIENLSAIPGKTGAFASGNVGAYGQEASQVLVQVEAVELASGQLKTFFNQDMHFAYRSSILNTIEKGKYVITGVTLQLHVNGKANMEYKGVQDYFAADPFFQPSLQQMRMAISAVRNKKLPDPKIIGNAGSFFKNVIVDQDQFHEIQKTITNNLGREVAEKIVPLNKSANQSKTELYKISAASLIELCGLKGLELGGAQVYPNHALVIVNTGTATATDIFNLAKKIKAEVFAKTHAQLMPEPIFLGFDSRQLSQS